MTTKKVKSDSLIICLTPLQMLIAERIVSLNRDSQFDLLVIALSDNEKYRYYYRRLSKICRTSLYYITSSGVLGFLNFTKELKLNKLHKKYKNIYLASIDSRLVQYTLSRNKNANIYTFDDGTANIISSSIYYSDHKPKLLKKLVWRCLGVKYYMTDIKSKSLLHYTIYKDLTNIIENTKFISLYQISKLQENRFESISQSKIIKIYLGQPLLEISAQYTNKFVNKVLDDLQIDLYYPHPRETNIPYSSFSVVTSDLIFEDYIVNYLKNNPNTYVHVYSFTSSCLLNISGLDKIKLTYLADSHLFIKFNSFYNLAKERFNISILKIN